VLNGNASHRPGPVYPAEGALRSARTARTARGTDAQAMHLIDDPGRRGNQSPGFPVAFCRCHFTQGQAAAATAPGSPSPRPGQRVGTCLRPGAGTTLPRAAAPAADCGVENVRSRRQRESAVQQLTQCTAARLSGRGSFTWMATGMATSQPSRTRKRRCRGKESANEAAPERKPRRQASRNRKPHTGHSAQQLSQNIRKITEATDLIRTCSRPGQSAQREEDRSS